MFVKGILKEILVFILTGCIYTVNLLAQPISDTLKFKVEPISIKEGLSQGFVLRILQDKEGVMWFATKDGLNKYDGYRFTVFRNDPKDPNSIPDNYVTNLVEDDHGRIWVGTNSKGVAIFDRKTEKFYRLHQKFNSSNYANSLIRVLEYRDNKLLIRRSDNAILLDIGKMAPNDYSQSNFNKIEQVFDYNLIQSNEKYKYTDGNEARLAWLKNSQLFISFGDSVFICAPDRSYKKWKMHRRSLKYYGINISKVERIDIAFTSDINKIVLICNEKLIVYNTLKDSVLHIRKFPVLMNSFGYHSPYINGSILLVNSAGTFWFDTRTYEIKCLHVDKISYRNVVSTCIDKSGILWMGTNTSVGVFKYNTKRQLIQNFPINGRFYYQLQNDEIGILPVDGPRIFNHRNGRTQLLLKTGLENHDYFTSYAITKNGIWYFNPIRRAIDQRVVMSYNMNNQQLKVCMAAECTMIFLDNEENLWLLITEKDYSRSMVKLNSQNGQILANYKIPIKNDINEYPFISALWQDKNKVFWMGTLQGLFSFNEKKNLWKHWKNDPLNENSLSGNMIFSLCPDAIAPDKYLWIGTNGNGLNKFEYSSGKFIRFHEKDGLPNEVIYGILNDDSGNMWISTNKGLSCRSVKTNRFRNFTEDDGLQANEFNRYDYGKLATGELLFGGVNGLSIFDPKLVLKESPPPTLIFTRFSIFNKEVTHKTDKTVLSGPLRYQKSITLPYEKNMFTIEFAALEYSPNDKKRYKYFLKGFTENWIDNETKNEVTFTHLSPGEYTFYVKGCNGDGVWNEKGTSLKIIITPPWWATWWARGAFVLILGFAAYGIYKYRLNEALKVAKMRDRIARDLHDEIGSTLSSISLFGESAKMMLPKESQVNAVLTKINESTSGMMESMNDIVWAINTRNDKFYNLINRIRDFSVRMMESRDGKVHFDLDDTMDEFKLDMEQRKNLYLILKEGVNNAAKYSNCKNLYIGVKYISNKLDVTIEDDGKGFKLNETKEGNGLINIKNRVSYLGGELIVESIVEKGTILKFSIPI